MARIKIVRALGVLLLALVVFINGVPLVAAQSSSEDDRLAMPYPNYFIAGSCHSDGWGTACAMDVNSIPNAGPLYSPITGDVVRMGNNDGYGNPFIVIQNSRWIVYMLHGVYDLVKVGDSVVIGQKIGTEASIGRSTGAHTHLSVYDRKYGGGWVNPNLAVNEILLNGQGVVLNTQGQSIDSSLNPQPPGEVNWDTSGMSDLRLVAGQGEQGLTAPQLVPEETLVTELATEVVIATTSNPLRDYLASIEIGIWGAIFLLLSILIFSKSSRSWWPVWMLLLGLVIYGFLWAHQVIGVNSAEDESLSGQTQVAATAQPEVVREAEFADPTTEDGTIVFPAIPIPKEVVEAIENNPPITVPQGSEYFPDPGPTMVRTVEILWEVAEERGIPPQFLLAKLYFEGGYMYNGRWMGLRNWKPDGSMTKSPSYADCRGIGQVCKYWHPNFDQARAGDLNDPEAALRYSAGFAADFLVWLYNQEGDWMEVVMRYHGTFDEGSLGQRLTRGFITNPPINPETGQPAWPAADLSILN